MMQPPMKGTKHKTRHYTFAWVHHHASGQGYKNTAKKLSNKRLRQQDFELEPRTDRDIDYWSY